MKELFYYTIFAIILYFLLSSVFDNFYLEQENFDPSLVPVSSIVTLAKVAQKLVNGNGTLTNPGNLQIGASTSTPGKLTVTGNTSINGSKPTTNKVNFPGSGPGQSLYNYLNVGNISMGDGWGTDSGLGQDIIYAPNLTLTSNNANGVAVIGDINVTGSGKSAPASFSYGQPATIKARIGSLNIGTASGNDVIQSSASANSLLIGSQTSGGTTQIWNNHLTVDGDLNIKANGSNGTIGGNINATRNIKADGEIKNNNASISSAGHIKGTNVTSSGEIKGDYGLNISGAFQAQTFFGGGVNVVGKIGNTYIGSIGSQGVLYSDTASSWLIGNTGQQIQMWGSDLMVQDNKSICINSNGCRASGATGGQFCIGTTCINEDHLKVLTCQASVNLQTRAVGKVLHNDWNSGKFEDQQTNNTGSAQYQSFYLRQIWK